MNTLTLFQKCLIALCLSGTGLCLSFLLAYRFRDELRQLHHRWLRLSPFSRAFAVLSLSVAVLYGGTKPPSSTNEPPASVGGDSTNEPPIIVEGDATNAPPGSTTGDAPTNVPPPLLMAGRVASVALAKDGPRPALISPSPSQTEEEPSTIHNSSFTLQTSWNTRGAFIDWQRVDFPASFAFPHGTNLLGSVTLMAWGEIRELHQSLTTNSQQLATLPQAVSLAPNESSCAYGLTPSNSYLFSWSSACPNRSPTNRVDASIELFASGACSVRFDTVETFYPAQPPPGFVGEGQDDAWLAAAFSPADYAAITNKGYDAWLADDWTGSNDPNGHVTTTITIHSLPPDGQPCYLVCGPYKVNVKQPGTYAFPLEVLTYYHVDTYPVEVPYSISSDDGFRSSPRLMAPRLLSAPQSTDDNVHDYVEYPRFEVDPSYVPYEQARGKEISILANIGPMTEFIITSFTGMSIMVLRGASMAEITRAEINDTITLYLIRNGYSCSRSVTIGEPPPDYHPHACCADCCGDYCRCDGTCCRCTCNCWGYAPEGNSNSTNSNANASEP